MCQVLTDVLRRILYVVLVQCQTKMKWHCDAKVYYLHCPDEYSINFRLISEDELITPVYLQQVEQSLA